MNFEQLNYVVTVAKSGSLSRASKKLYITQSALSQSITKLEEKLDVQIFERCRKRGTIPTDTGRNIVEIAREILAKQDTLIEIAKTKAPTSLKIGTYPSMLSFFPQIISHFKKDHPMIEIDITESTESSIVNDLLHGDLDLALEIVSLDRLKENSSEIEWRLLSRTPIMIAANKDSSVGMKESLTVKEISKQPIVICKNEALGKVLDGIRERYKDINVVFSSNSSETIGQAVGENIGITIAFEILIMNSLAVANGQAVPVEISDMSEEYGLVAAYSKKTKKMAYLEDFILRIEENVGALKRYGR